MNSLKTIISVILKLACIAGASPGGTNLAGVTSDDPQVLAGRVMLVDR